MGVRLKGEYYSTSGELWTWQLIDTGFGDLQHDTQLTSEGLQFRWDGDAKNKDSRFITCTCSFSIQVNHNYIEDFRDAIINSAEGRFFLRAGKDGGVTYIGRVTVDDGQWEDNARPYPFRLIATDGIGALKDRNYSNTTSGEVPYEDQPTLLQHTINCLDKTGIKDHYTGQDYLWVICDTYEDQHPNSTDNPLAVTRVDAKAFYTPVEETGAYEYKSCGEVLRNILVNFRSSLIYVGPHYLIQQRNARANASFRVFKYSTAGALIGSATVSDEITVSNAGAINYRKGISSFGFLPGMLKSTVKYNHGEQDVNMLNGFAYEGYNHYADPGPDNTLHEVGTVTVAAGEKVNLRFSGKLRTKSDFYGGSPAPRFKNHRYWGRIRLKTQSTATTKWWRRDFLNTDFYSGTTAQYNFSYWDNGEEYYDFITDIIDEQQRDVNIFHNWGFDTQNLTAGEVHTISFSFEMYRVFDEDLNVVDLSGNPVKCWWEFSDLELVALEDGELLKRPTATISEVTGNVLNSYSLEEEVIIGDGPGKSSIGRLQVYTGSEWKDSRLWSAAGETSRKLHLIAAQEALAGQQTSLLVMQGGYYATTNAATAMSRIYYSGRYFLLLSGSYNTPSDLWEGEYVEIITPVRTGLTPVGKTEVTKHRVSLPVNPGKLPFDEQKQDRVIKFPFLTKDGLISGTPITTINMATTATTNLFYERDIIYIVDPVHGHAEKVTVAADLKPGDTSLSIESFTPLENYPPGSYLEPDPAFVQNNTYSETNEVYHLENNFSGTSFVCSHDLTDISLESDQGVLSKRHRVFKNGQKLIYGHAMGWSINNGTNSVVLAETCYGDYIEVYSYKTRKVSYVAVSSLSSGSGSGSGTLGAG